MKISGYGKPDLPIVQESELNVVWPDFFREFEFRISNDLDELIVLQYRSELEKAWGIKKYCI